MASSEKEVNWLSTEILPKLLRECKLVNIVQESDLQQFRVKTITVNFIGAQEAFSLTSCYRACVAYEYKGVADEINFFVKKTPQLPQELFDVINFKSLFSNEILAYEKIIPSLENFGKCKFNTAKFYYGDLQSNFATVVTEDFGSNGWRITKERTNLSLEHALLAVKYLAKFHAVGFALRATNRTTFDELTKDLSESRYANDNTHPQYALKIKFSIKRTVDVARELHKEIPEALLEKFGQLENTFYQYGKKMMQPEEPMVTLCHGDYLRNNVAYKYDESSGQPTDIMMFDLQTFRVASPMVDLTTFLALSTFAEVRYKNFKTIFAAYCEQLQQTYKDIVKQELPSYLSYDSLLKEYIKFLPYSTVITASFLSVLVEPEELASEEMLLQQLSDDEIYQDVMSRGGEVVRRELAHQVKEFSDLSQENKVVLVLGKL